MELDNFLMVSNVRAEVAILGLVGIGIIILIIILTIIKKAKEK